jgi:RHS repeat-associated protein
LSAAKSRASGKTITIPDAAVMTRPFGLNMAGPWMNDAALDNRYQYNSKELNDDFGLGWNDYGARWYDAAVGRWWSVDPMVDKWNQVSPYIANLNSPLVFRDVEGADVIVAFTGGPTGGGKTIDYRSQESGTAGKVVRDAENFAKENGIDFSGTVITPGVTSSSSVDNAMAFISRHYTPGEKLVIYGYSYGGDFAVELTAKLGELGIPVDLLITIDASDGPLQQSTVDNEVPDNVVLNENFYQDDNSGASSSSRSTDSSSGSTSGSSSGKTSSSSRNSGTSDSPDSNGGPNKAKDTKKTTVNNHNKSGKGVTHGNIDEKVMDDVRNQIQNAMRRQPLQIIAPK